MDATHIHLLLNHFPVLGTVFAGLLLSIALVYKDARFQKVSYVFLLFFALVAIAVYLTGEPAEEVVEHLPGVSEASIHSHEDMALIAFVAMEVLGGLVLLGLVVFRRAVSRRATRIPNYFSLGMLALTICCVGLLARTAYLGAQIRHSEIRGGSPVSMPADSER